MKKLKTYILLVVWPGDEPVEDRLHIVQLQRRWSRPARMDRVVRINPITGSREIGRIDWICDTMDDARQMLKMRRFIFSQTTAQEVSRASRHNDSDAVTAIRLLDVGMGPHELCAALKSNGWEEQRVVLAWAMAKNRLETRGSEFRSRIHRYLLVGWENQEMEVIGVVKRVPKWLPGDEYCEYVNRDGLSLRCGTVLSVHCSRSDAVAMMNAQHEGGYWRVVPPSRPGVMV